MSDHVHVLDGLAALCGTGSALPVLVSALFVAGLAGGVTHCAGMCGPFVLTQVSQRLAAIDVAEFGALTRLSGAALLPYHVGRATTYTALGAAAAWLSAGFIDMTQFRWAASLFLLLAAGLFLASLAGALRITAPSGVVFPSRWLAPLFADPRRGRGYLLGVALGFLPCGLVYSALAAAMAAGNALGGAIAMAAFAAGTVPALVAVGFGGWVAGRRWRSGMARFAKPMLAVNAALLVALALRDLL